MIWKTGRLSIAISVAALCAAAAGGPGFAQSPTAGASSLPATPGADRPEAVRHAWRSRLDGRHFDARIRLVIHQQDRSDGERRLRVWRDDRGDAGERLLARFHEPYDLRGVAVLYLEQPDRVNDYFLFRPTLNKVRRVPEGLTREDLYGLDLEFLGFDVAGNEPTVIEGVKEVKLDGRDCLSLTERAQTPNPRFDRRTVWLDAVSFIPLRSEYQIDGATTVIGRTLEVRDIQGVPTPIHTRFERPAEGHTVDLHIDTIDYEAEIGSNTFSTLELTKRWYRRSR